MNEFKITPKGLLVANFYVIAAIVVIVVMLVGPQLAAKTHIQSTYSRLTFPAELAPPTSVWQWGSIDVSPHWTYTYTTGESRSVLCTKLYASLRQQGYTMISPASEQCSSFSASNTQGKLMLDISLITDATNPATDYGTSDKSTDIIDSVIISAEEH